MFIQLDSDYAITSNSKEFRLAKAGKLKGQLVWTNIISRSPKIDHILEEYISVCQRTSEPESIDELISVTKEALQRISSSLNPDFTVNYREVRT